VRKSYWVVTCCTSANDRNRFNMAFSGHSALTVSVVPNTVHKDCFERTRLTMEVSYRMTNHVESSFRHRITQSQHQSRAGICLGTCGLAQVRIYVSDLVRIADRSLLPSLTVLSFGLMCTSIPFALYFRQNKNQIKNAANNSAGYGFLPESVSRPS
jgi:hypothetical protein